MSNTMNHTQIPTLTSSDIASISLTGLDTISLDSIDTFDLSSLDPITINLNNSLTGGTYGSAIPSSIYNNTLPITGLGTGVTYANSPSITWGNAISPNTSIGSLNGTTKIVGDTEIQGNLKVNGKDIGELLGKIEERLAICHPDPVLEEKWEELRELAKKYNELAADIKEKEQIWAILKK